MALNKIAKEILEADQCLLKKERTCNINSQSIDFEEASAQLVAAMSAPKSSQMLMKYILENPAAEGQGVEAVIESVVNSEILVRPETFVVFLKFSKQLVELQHNEVKKAAFLKANKKELPASFKSTIEGFAVDFTTAESGILTKLGQFSAQGQHLADSAKQKQNEMMIKEGQVVVPLKQKFISNLAYYSGQTEEDIVNKTAKTAGIVMGGISAVTAASAVDNKIYKALGAVGAAVMVAPVGAIAAGAVGVAAVGAGGLALGAAAKWLYNSMPTWKSSVKEEAPKEIPVPQNIAEASKLESRTQDLLEGNLKCEDLVHDDNFDIQPSPQLAVSVSSPQAKPALQQMSSASPVALAGVQQNAIIQQPVIEPPALASAAQKTTVSIAKN